MYLKSISLQNVGPITNLNLELPFENEFPQPLVLVGPNGSGKSTVLSFIVHALIAFKQQVFEDAEVDRMRVFRIRGPMYIRGRNHWYHAKLDFSDGLGLEEWVLDRKRSEFEKTVNPLPASDGWKHIKADELDRLSMTPNPQFGFPGMTGRSQSLETLFAKNAVLYFPSDRFELPDWLNEQSLSQELKFPEPPALKGQTSRRILSRALLRTTLQWLKAVVLDSRLNEYEPNEVASSDGTISRVLVHKIGRDSQIIDAVFQVLASILGADRGTFQIHFGQRNSGLISATFSRLGKAEFLPSLLGLSAGQAALFCLFCNIIRDFDLAGAPFNQPADVQGIVVVDEADHHLHVELQYQLFPELMKLFPKVQFVVTAHSPLFVMGMENAFGPNGFRIVDLPSGNTIDAEQFCEFENALNAFCKTRTFNQRILEQIKKSLIPVVLVEGKNDVIHIQTAWQKLNPRTPMPWEIIPCGGISTAIGRGGANMLKKVLEACCCVHSERPVLGLFDHDAEGVEQFGGLKAAGFVDGQDRLHQRHCQRPVSASLLPVSTGRENFVSDKARQCCLGIEHYYSDEILRQFDVAGDTVAVDSKIFGISTDSKRKSEFAARLDSLPESAFTEFKTLFDRLSQVLGVETETVTTESPATALTYRIDCGLDSSPSANLFTTELASTIDAATVDGHDMPEPNLEDKPL